LSEIVFAHNISGGSKLVTVCDDAWLFYLLHLWAWFFKKQNTYVTTWRLCWELSTLTIRSVP